MTVASNPTRKPPSATVAAMRINLNSALVMLPLRKTKNQAFLIYLQPVAEMLLAWSRCCQGKGCRGDPLAHGFKDFSPLAICNLQSQNKTCNRFQKPLA